MAGSREGSHRANRLGARTSAGHTAEVGVAAAAGTEDDREAEVESATIAGETETTRLDERVGAVFLTMFSFSFLWFVHDLAVPTYILFDMRFFFRRAGTDAIDQDHEKKGKKKRNH